VTDGEATRRVPETDRTRLYLGVVVTEIAVLLVLWLAGWYFGP